MKLPDGLPTKQSAKVKSFHVAFFRINQNSIQVEGFLLVLQMKLKQAHQSHAIYTKSLFGTQVLE